MEGRGTSDNRHVWHMRPRLFCVSFDELLMPEAE